MSQIPDVRDFGAVPDAPAFDNRPAFEAAMAASSTLWMPGEYFFGGTLHVRSRVYFMGAGMGDEDKPAGTLLRFPANCDGLRVHSTFDEPGSDGNHSFFANLNVAGTVGSSGHGVHSSARIYMQNVCITSFGGDGVHLDGRGTGYGATSHSQFWNVRSGRNGGYGYHPVGSDACNMFFAGCEAVVNGQHGVFDESTVGNTYESMHLEANCINAVTGGPADGVSWHDVKNLNTGLNAAYFSSCYAESPSINELYFPAKVDGGLLSQAAFTPASTAPVFNSNRLANTALLSTNANGGNQTEVTLGTQGVGQHLLGLSGSDGTNLNRWEIDWEPSIRKMVWRKDGAGPWGMALSMTDDRPEFPHGIRMTGIDENVIYGGYSVLGFSASMPTTPMPGAVIFKRGRSAGDPMGWSCLIDGTWEPFG